MSILLHYKLMDLFKKNYYRDLLRSEHLLDGELRIKELVFEDGSMSKNFCCYPLEKDGVKYLLPSTTKDPVTGKEKQIIINETLPIRVSSAIDNAHKTSINKVVYYTIDSYTIQTFRAEKRMSFKELIDKLTSLEHSNPEHQKVMMFVAVASALDRLVFRVASNAGFGKDSSVITMNSLLSGCAAVASPSQAKLSYMAQQKWLMLSEVLDMTKEDSRIVQQFCLDTGDGKPTFTKPKKAINKGPEILDISNLSITVCYNQIDEYVEGDKKYFDVVMNYQFIDRFPPLRLWGKFSKTTISLGNLDMEEKVNNNMDFYKDLIYSLFYYKRNNRDETHFWMEEVLQEDGSIEQIKHSGWRRITKHMNSERWKANFDILLNYVDLYSENQEEFSKWEKVIYDALDDYQEMLFYPEHYNKATSKLAQKQVFSMAEKLRSLKTFKEKNNYLRKAATGETDYVEANTTKWF